MKEKEDYKREIIDMINKIEDVNMLGYFYTFIRSILEKWGD